MAVWQIKHSYRRGQLTTDTGYPIDFENDTLKVALVNNTLTPDVSVQDYWDDFQANEVSGINYTAGGFTLTTTVGAAGATVTMDSDDPNWVQDVNGFDDAFFAIYYKDSGVASTSPVIAFNDITGPKGNKAGPLTLTTTTGLFTQTQTP